jgi:hypothetical protein
MQRFAADSWSGLRGGPAGLHDSGSLTMVSSKRLCTDAMMEVRGSGGFGTGCMAAMWAAPALLTALAFGLAMRSPQLRLSPRPMRRSCSPRSAATRPAATTRAPCRSPPRCPTWCWSGSSATAATGPCTRVRGAAGWAGGRAGTGRAVRGRVVGGVAPAARCPRPTHACTLPARRHLEEDHVGDQGVLPAGVRARGDEGARALQAVSHAAAGASQQNALAPRPRLRAGPDPPFCPPRSSLARRPAGRRGDGGADHGAAPLHRRGLHLHHRLHRDRGCAAAARSMHAACRWL